MAEFHQALPAIAVTVTAPLRLTLKDQGGKEWGAFLDNAYNEYLQDTSAQEEVIRRYAASLAATSAAGEGSLNPQHIVPVIKDAAWPQEMRRSVGEGAAEQVVEDFNGDLVIVYAEDTPSNTRYFSPGDLEDAGIERSGLRTLAVANLRQLLPPVDVHNGPLVSMLTAGGDYVASLLLMEELWSGEKLSVDGDIVIAVPTRDVVLFTGSRNADGVAKLRDMARKAVTEGTYALTDRLFVYRDGRFQRFEP